MWVVSWNWAKLSVNFLEADQRPLKILRKLIPAVEIDTLLETAVIWDWVDAKPVN